MSSISCLRSAAPTGLRQRETVKFIQLGRRQPTIFCAVVTTLWSAFLSAALQLAYALYEAMIEGQKQLLGKVVLPEEQEVKSLLCLFNDLVYRVKSRGLGTQPCGGPVLRL